MIQIQHIHPMIVHFPIVFFLTLAAFDGIAWFLGIGVTGQAGAAHISAALAVLAGVSAAIAYFFGDIALDVAREAGLSSAIAETHETLGTITAVGFAVWALLRAVLWWRNLRLGGAMAAAVPLVELLGAILVIATAYYGGQLVYQLGVNVAHPMG